MHEKIESTNGIEKGEKPCCCGGGGDDGDGGGGVDAIINGLPAVIQDVDPNQWVVNVHLQRLNLTSIRHLLV